ncbi:MAG: response regulator [Crocinitomicaceae bacterium]
MKILIGDDHELISSGIIANFMSNGRTDEFETAKNKTELIQHLIEQTFDVLILDVQFGDDDARVIIKEIDAMNLEMKRIALSSHEDEVTVKSVLASGFQSYVSKSAPLTELIEAVESVSRGEQYISKDLEKKMFASLFSNDSTSAEIRLTKREKEVLKQIQAGLSTKQIAEKLFIAEKNS